MNHPLYSLRFPKTLAALALALGLATGAGAAPADAGPAGPGAGMPAYAMHGQRMQGPERALRGFARLHDELKLDAQQEALWSDAAKAARDAHAAMRERFRKEHEELRAALARPGADLRALAGRSDELRAEARAQHQATRDRWLAVYDALNPEQKERARAFLARMLERAPRNAAQNRRPA